MSQSGLFVSQFSTWLTKPWDFVMAGKASGEVCKPDDVLSVNKEPVQNLKTAEKEREYLRYQVGATASPRRSGHVDHFQVDAVQIANRSRLVICATNRDDEAVWLPFSVRAPRT